MMQVLNRMLGVLLGILGAVLGVVLGIVAALVWLVGAVLCVTVLLIPLGIPVMKLGSRVLSLAREMMRIGGCHSAPTRPAGRLALDCRGAARTCRLCAVCDGHSASARPSAVDRRSTAVDARRTADAAPGAGASHRRSDEDGEEEGARSQGRYFGRRQ